MDEFKQAQALSKTEFVVFGASAIQRRLEPLLPTWREV